MSRQRILSRPGALVLVLAGFLLVLGGPDVLGVAAQAPPAISSITPRGGPAAGGTRVTIIGSGFSTVPGETRFVNGLNNRDPVFVNVSCSNTTTCTGESVAHPDATLGVEAQPVHVFVRGQQSQGGPFFAWFGQPLLHGIDPTVGPAAGGTVVTLTGYAFPSDNDIYFGGPVPTVRFGTTPAPNVSCPTTSSCIATAPPGSGNVEVTIETVGGTSNSQPFTYITPPTVSAIAPAFGPVGGGTVVGISGAGFIPGQTSVRFGGTQASAVTCQGTANCIATSPPGPAAGGTVSVRVTVGALTSPDTPADDFTYVPAPIVSAVSPSAGPTSGGTPVTITGSGFQPGASVRFGDAPATGVSVESATQLRAITPEHAPSAVAVSVTNRDGQSGTRQNAFTYSRRAPTIHQILPTSGPPSGGTLVTIVGSDFGLGAEVYLGNTRASLPVCALLLCVVVSPPGTGTVPVTVRTAAGTSNGVPFTYTGSSSSAAPTSTAPLTTSPPASPSPRLLPSPPPPTASPAPPRR